MFATTNSSRILRFIPRIDCDFLIVGREKFKALATVGETVVVVCDNNNNNNNTQISIPP